ncbi:hypothetical protein AB1Y20_021540 [Prymnesium parvum]|uniref:DedA family protein n=1 Tax=Prymnesium parvum TaxID=97485 RepID=A0AB34JMH6_PRYPA|eukprot:CAMPEP_0184390656 /NCGR_PEP_ID=MMETSP0007-20130409/13476_1 /TAXON_ID=97485 /ORGANISM="Prymnesium parvum, Strain Texoma1" /LENGTH=187 /DNA_ID=CAMNT_0026740471 /DNA_START=174 /DNA_END=737 /DNA_ORIENTATION=+
MPTGSPSGTPHHPEEVRGWARKTVSWAEKHVNAKWFPWFLALVGFVDYFSFGAMGVIITPLLTIGLIASTPRRGWLLIGLLSAGCFAGSFAFSQLVEWLEVSRRLEGSTQLSVARDLLERHGILAGALNTIFPLPTIPLIVAAHALKVQIPLILLAMAFGRFVRWSTMFATIHSSKAVARSIAHPKQ